MPLERLAIATVAGLMITVSLVACGAKHMANSRAGTGVSGQAAITGPRSTEALIDSIGVVVHFNYVDTAYRRLPEILAALRALGLRHIRDAVAAPGSPLAAGLRAARRQGITADLGAADMAIPASRSVADSLRVLRGAIYAFEGPNEVDSSGYPGWPQTLEAYMRGLAAAVHEQAPGVPVVQPSFLVPANSRLAPELPGLYNEHPYPLGGPPEAALRKVLPELPADAVQRGLVFTETGYHNALDAQSGQPPVSEQAAAVYLPRMLVDDFANGVRSTFIYELADEKPDPGLTDPEQHFGLLRSDLSPKPAFSAISTLISALRASPGPGAPDRPRLRLDAGADVSRLELTRPDGSQVLALWRPVSVWDALRRRPIEQPVQSVTVTFEGSARDVAVWRPSASSLPVERRTVVRSLSLGLGADLILVSFR